MLEQSLEAFLFPCCLEKSVESGVDGPSPEQTPCPPGRFSALECPCQFICWYWKGNSTTFQPHFYYLQHNTSVNILYAKNTHFSYNFKLLYTSSKVRTLNSDFQTLRFTVMWGARNRILAKVARHRHTVAFAGR
jgi:hypothetical protein